MATGGGGGGGDNLADFFDFSKPWVRRERMAPSAPRMVEVDPLSIPPPATSEEEKAAETEAQWQKHQKTVLRQLMIESQTSCHGMSTCGGLTNSMSGVESDTFVETLSISPHSSKKDLVNCFDFSKRCQEAWKLPIAQRKEEILDKIAENQVVVLSGPTGCGKSTQVPQFILDQHAKEKRRVNILVTQPRKIAASSVARRVCQERGWSLGGLVGYQVGLDKLHKSLDTRLLYVTTGILKRMLIAKKHLNEWTHVILDEVHEREEDMDVVMLICKKLLLTNSRDTKLILMSATLDQSKFQSYFASLRPEMMVSPGQMEAIKAPIISLEARREGIIQVYYWNKLEKLMRQRYPGTTVDHGDFDLGEPSLSESSVAMCRVLLEKLDGLEDQEHEGGKREAPGAVLIFLPGLQEIKQVRDFLLAKDPEERRTGPEWRCMALHSSVPWEEHQTVFEPLPLNQRKVILSTNIAESSLTIPDIRYVIDFCLTKNMVADPETDYPRLMLQWASQSQMIQRKGRAGRVGDKGGRVYRLVPEDFCRRLPQDHEPEMTRVPLTKVVLDVKMLSMGSPKDLLALAMDPPDLRSIRRTVLALKEMGALLTTARGVQCKEDGDLTVLGEVVARLPVDVKLGKLVVFGHIFGVLEEAIIIASGLNGKSIFTSPFDRRVQSYKNKLHWADRTHSDCFAILAAYQVWEMKKMKGEFSGKDGVRDREGVWCKQSFLQRKQLMEMKTQVEEITRSLRMMGIEPLQTQEPISWETEKKFHILRLVMFGAFYPNYFVKVSSDDIEKRADRTLHGLDPKNTVYLHGFDQDQAKYGELYADQVKSMFKEATLDVENIRLTFEGARIFVEFDKRAEDDVMNTISFMEGASGGRVERNLTGSISSEVYVSVKMRQRTGADKAPKMFVYQEEVAEQKYNEWRTAVENNVGGDATHLIKPVEGPGPEVKEIIFEEVTHVSSPNAFWLHCGDKVEENLDRLQEIISSVVNSLEAVESPQAVVKGGFYIAPFADEEDEEPCLYRARVTYVRGDLVTVFFIDYGNTVVLPFSELMIISSQLIRDHPDIVNIPGQALECRLAQLQPSSIRNSKGLWDEEVVARFTDLVTRGAAEGRLSAKIFSVLESSSSNGGAVVALETLMVKTDGQLQDARCALIAEHLAETAPESYLSKQNKQERKLFRAKDRASERDLRSKYNQRASQLRPVKDSSKLSVKVDGMSGPFSPLEHKVQCLHRHGSTKTVAIDSDSVNTVLLDQCPGERFDHYMVAASVRISPGGQGLQLYSCSWMPSRMGLGALATMIFSPRVEMRTNQDRTRITGCLSGLGPRTHWDKPEGQVTMAERTEGYYPEHDIETRFDVNINNEDVSTVNKIRHWMNQSLAKTEDGVMALTQVQTLDKSQKRIKEHLEELFTRTRFLQDKEPMPQGREYRWNMVDKQHRLGVKISGNINLDNQIFKMIDGLIVKAPEEQQVLETLLELHRIKNSSDYRLLPANLACPICPEFLGKEEEEQNLPNPKVLESPHAIYLHVTSVVHKEQEEQLLNRGSSSTVAS